MTSPTASQPTQQRGNTVTTTPTLEEFLTAPPNPEEDEELAPMQVALEAPAFDPLTSIAGSLERLVAIVEKVEDEAAVEESQAQRLVEDLQRENDAKQALLEEVLRLIKPSTSKLSNQVRALLEPPVAPAPEVKPPLPPEQPADDAPIEEQPPPEPESS